MYVNKIVLRYEVGQILNVGVRIKMYALVLRWLTQLPFECVGAGTVGGYTTRCIGNGICILLSFVFFFHFIILRARYKKRNVFLIIIIIC